MTAGITEAQASERLEYLKFIVEVRCNPLLRRLNHWVLELPRFFDAPGGAKHHHNYRHGLVQHVSEVMGNAIGMGSLLKSDQLEVLVTAVVWHDVLKIRDYSFGPEDGIQTEPYQKLIHHVAGSFAEFYHRALCERLSPEFIDRVSHCLLSHHGRREWGSPVEPQSVEAFILHTADMLSASGIVL